MKKYSLLVSFFFVFFSFSAFAVDGYWEQRFPEKSPPARNGHAMASIGERKVLMINGVGDKNYYYYNDTWLYDYDSNTWTQVYCVTPPSTDLVHICKISKNRVLWTGSYSHNSELAQNWIFDLDSMKWFELDLALSPEARQNQGMAYFKENIAFLYGGRSIIGYTYHKYKDTWLATIIESKIDSPYFINWEKTLDEDKGDTSPDSYYNYDYEGHKFDYLNNDMPIMFIPEYANFHFLFFHPEENKWKLLKLGVHEPPITRSGAYCNLTENIILGFGGYTWEDMYGVPICDWTCLMLYTPRDSIINAHQLNLSNTPQPRVWNACAKIDDGIAMMFAGQYFNKDKTEGYNLNDTWIFHLTDKTDPRGDIHEDTDTADIRLISNNIYELSVVCKAELYDMVGRNITTPSVEAPATPSGKGNCIIDLNGLPVGIYLLKYFHKSNWNMAKLVRY